LIEHSFSKEFQKKDLPNDEKSWQDFILVELFVLLRVHDDAVPIS